MARVQAAMSAVFDDMDGVLDEVVAMSREALERNRSESGRIKVEMSELDRMLAGLSRILVDPEIEPLAKRSISRQIAECESKREGLREGLDAVAVQAVDDMDTLMGACRQAFLEAKADFASLMSPAQVNRFIAEVVGPMAVLPDGSVVQKEVDPKVETLGSMKVAGAGFEPTTSGL